MNCNELQNVTFEWKPDPDEKPVVEAFSSSRIRLWSNRGNAKQRRNVRREAKRYSTDADGMVWYSCNIGHLIDGRAK